MDCVKVQGYLLVIRYWSERGNTEIQRGDNNAVESALRIIEGKVEAIREELRGVGPIEPELPQLTQDEK